MKTVDFETSVGVRIKLRPISPDLLEAIRLKVVMPAPPTYEVEVLGGGKETVTHDEKSVETDEEKLAWAKYSVELELAKATIFERQTIAIMRRCVLVDLPENTGWIRAQQADGIEVPTDPDELKFHYIQTEVIGSYTDALAIVSIVREMSRYSKEDLDQAMSLFRNDLARKTDS